MAPKKQPTNRTSAPKPAAKSNSSKSTGQKPMEYLFGWVGRQVGHVKKAVQTDVTKPTAKGSGAKAAANKSAAKPKPTNPSSAKSRPSAQPSVPPATTNEKIIYRHDEVEEAEIPHRPGMILRRTIIDEVVVETSETIAPPPKKPGSK